MLPLLLRTKRSATINSDEVVKMVMSVGDLYLPPFKPQKTTNAFSRTKHPPPCYPKALQARGRKQDKSYSFEFTVNRRVFPRAPVQFVRPCPPEDVAHGRQSDVAALGGSFPSQLPNLSRNFQKPERRHSSSAKLDKTTQTQQNTYLCL